MPPTAQDALCFSVAGASSSQQKLNQFNSPDAVSSGAVDLAKPRNQGASGASTISSGQKAGPNRIFSVYGLDETPVRNGNLMTDDDGSTNSPEYVHHRKPLHNGVRLEAMDHEFSK